MGAGLILLIGSAVKLAAVCGVGIGASHMMETFHNFKFKNKKKGDNNELSHSEILRKKSEELR